MSTKNGHWVGDVFVCEVYVSNISVKLVDKGKRDINESHYVNAGFFGVYNAERFTLPVGHLIADYEADSANTQAACKERGTFDNGRFRFDCGSWAYDNAMHGKAVTTLVLKNGRASVVDLTHAPELGECDYAVSCIPIMRDGKDVKWKTYVSPQGWGADSLRATLHPFIGIKEDPSIVYIMAWESKSDNLIYSAEAFEVFSAMGFRDVIKLDGGGSTILVDGGREQATVGNRRINSILTWHAEEPTEKPSKRLKIALGAGHSINTSGKRCLKSLDPNETREWQLNDRVCDAVEVLLQEHDGYEVLRLDDSDGGEEDVKLVDRVKAANAWGADLYLSIHHNAGIGGGSGGGIVAYTHPKSSATSVEWRDELYEALIEHTGLRGNRANPKATSNLYVLRETDMPAVLLELGFMDSSTDVPIILTEEHAQACARAIVEVIVQRGGLTRKATEDAPADWVEEAWDKAAAAGVLDGTRPLEYLTRQELAAVLAKLGLV